MRDKLQVKVGEKLYTVEVIDLDSSASKVIVDGELVEVDLDLGSVGVENTSSEVSVPPITKSTPDIVDTPGSDTGSNSSAKVFSTPMPGVIVSIAVKVGDLVVTGDEVCVLEAMKMQQTLRADWTGKVTAVHVQAGSQLLAGDPIAELG